MTTEDKRLILAAALAELNENRGWIFTVDGKVPPDATDYAVYDALTLQGCGRTPSMVPGIAANCRMPIVFYVPKAEETEAAGA